MERKTSQRQAIRRAVREMNRPLSPKEILEAAQRFVPGLGIATVYRTVKILLDEGWLAEIDVPGGPSRYEVAGKPHHHHFHCRNCDGVFEVTGCLPEVNRLTPAGFRLEGHEIILYGVCGACSGSGAVMMQ